MLFVKGRQQVRDSNNEPVVLAKVSFYLTQTVTPAPVYADAALTTPLTQPVRTDGFGYMNPVYYDPAVTYGCTITDKDGAALPDGTVDPISFSALYGLDADDVGLVTNIRTDAEISAGVTPTSYRYPAGDIRRYGAVADGDSFAGTGTDALPAILKAFSVANEFGRAGGGRVLIPAGVYRLSAGFSIPAGIMVQGEGKWSKLFVVNAFSDMDGVVRFDDAAGGPPATLDNIAIVAQDGGCTGSGIVITANGSFATRLWVNGFVGFGSVGILVNATDCFVTEFAVELCFYGILIGAVGTSANVGFGTVYGCSAAGFITVNGASGENGRVVVEAVRASDCAQDGFVVSAGKVVSFDDCHVIATDNSKSSVSGFNIGASADVAMNECTARVSGTTSVAGIGFKLASGSIVQLTGCKARGFLDGANIASCDNVTVTGGMYHLNGRDGIRIAAGSNINVSGVNAIGNGACGINDVNSDASCNHSVTGSTATGNGTYGIFSNITGAGSYTNVSGNTARLNPTKNIQLAGAISRHAYSGNLPDFYDSAIPSAVAATALTLPAVPKGLGEDIVSVTGATAVTSIDATDNFGRLVTLHMIDGFTLTNGSNLKIGANFVGTADDLILLYCNGTNWYRRAAGTVN